MLAHLLLPLLLLCSDQTAPVWVLGDPVTTPRASGSDQKPPLYMIFFKDDASQKDKKEYAKELEKAITTESMGSISVGKDDFILGALLTDSQLSKWNKSPVNKIEQANSTMDQEETEAQSDLEARDIFHNKLPVNDDEAPGDRWPEMVFLSQPPMTNSKPEPLEDLGEFAFEDEAGSGVTIYVHDSGINQNHEEFTQNPDGISVGKVSVLEQKKSLFGNLFASSFSGDRDGHGTCMASKVVGNKYGSAKSADLKMVPMTKGWNTGFAIPEVLIGLDTIIDDIQSVRKKRKRDSGDASFFPVINFSYSVGVDETEQENELDAWEAKIKQLLDLDAAIVISSGNAGRDHPDVHRYPALFAKKFPELIVVGAVDPEGEVPRWTNRGDLVKFWAPGTRYTLNRLKQYATSKSPSKNRRDLKKDIQLKIECAAPGKNDATSYREGTSIAAATVSGLVAYAMSIDSSLLVKGKVQENVKKWLSKRSYPRRSGGKPAVYNGALPELWCSE